MRLYLATFSLRNSTEMHNDCIYLKLNTSVRDKICFYVHICSPRIRYESSIKLLPLLSPMEMHEIMWPVGGRCKSKTIQSMWRFLQGRKIDQRGGKQCSRASFYSSFISAENCLCSGIRQKCACRRARSRNPFIYDTQHAECILGPQFNSSAVHSAQCCVSQLCLV